jgi:hypothetical protein
VTTDDLARRILERARRGDTKPPFYWIAESLTEYGRFELPTGETVSRQEAEAWAAKRERREPNAIIVWTVFEEADHDATQID